MKNLDAALLCRPAIEVLSVIQVNDLIISSVDTLHERIKNRFPNYLRVLEKHLESIKEKDTRPYSLEAQHRVTIPLYDKVKAELSKKGGIGVHFKGDITYRVVCAHGICP